MNEKKLISRMGLMACVSVAFAAGAIERASFGPLTPSARASERQYIWPDGKIPHYQVPLQVAAKSGELKQKDFRADDFRRPYIDWYVPISNRTDLCVMTVSGGGFCQCCDAERLQPLIDRLVAMGVTVADLTYRTPRPEGLPIYQSGWEDAQRAVRFIRSQAARRGYAPEKIGATGISAGGKVVLLLATSSETRAYEPVDAIDELPCNLLFACPQAPAYVLADGAVDANSRGGEGDDIPIVPELHFDAQTCPMCFSQGGIDVFSPMGSIRLAAELRRRGIPSELHLYADRWHGFHGDANRGDNGTGWDHWVYRVFEFMRQMNYDGRLGASVPLTQRFASDADRLSCERQDLWPKGRVPDRTEGQCEPYLEWHMPRQLKTHAIQIICSGGGYTTNSPHGSPVIEARRYLNAKGMAVVTLQYRWPRPTNLPKHLSAWQDMQRTIRLVRSGASARGLDPDRIGVMGNSAGGHLALLAATSSRQLTYRPIDAADKLPCNVQWAVAIYPAYVLDDGVDCRNTTRGLASGVRIVKDFSFDLDTCPVLFLHGDADGYAAEASVRMWGQLRRMGVQCDLHTLATRGHCFGYSAAPGTGSYTVFDRIWEFMNHKEFNK